MFRAAILGFAVALVAAAPAHGAAAWFVGDCAGSLCGEYLVYRAEPGETNLLTTEVGPDHRGLILRDAGATIRGCPAVEGGVRCADSGGYAPSTLNAHLGDGDDQAKIGGSVWGGAGNDRLTANRELSGGPGDDVLTGGFSQHDDDGDTPGHDVYTGAKELHYDKHETSVRVDLRPGRLSEDRIEGNPKVWAGPAADVLIGDDAPNQLFGTGGDDRVVGSGGDDVLSGNRVDGGAGDDEISGGWFGGRLRCGPGRDLAVPLPRALVSSDCEYVSLDEEGGERRRVHADLRRLASPIVPVAACADCEHPDRWRVLYRGRIIGERVAAKRPSHLRLNADGRALLRRRDALRVQVVRRTYRYWERYENEGFRVELTR